MADPTGILIHLTDAELWKAAAAGGAAVASAVTWFWMRNREARQDAWAQLIAVNNLTNAEIRRLHEQIKTLETQVERERLARRAAENAVLDLHGKIEALCATLREHGIQVPRFPAYPTASLPPIGED